MRRTLTSFFIFSLLVLSGQLYGQLQLTVQVDSARLSTACGDIFGPPDPTDQVSVNGNPFVNYDFGANPCFETAPHQPYDTLVNGRCNLPATVEVCFRVFDNDGDFIPCLVIPECLEEVCVDLAVPAVGVADQDTLSIMGSTDGDLFLTLFVSQDTMDFNYICGAEDLGTIGGGQTLGDAAAGIYDNYCADNEDEINPIDFGTNFDNDYGVWFNYQTGPDVSPLQIISVTSDPEATGDIIDLELLVYLADSCTGTLERFDLFRRRNSGDDSRIELYCVEPGMNLYVLVDGRGNTDSTRQGVFSIEVVDPGQPEGGDLRCEATPLGTVPEGGSVSTPTQLGNFCSGFSDDPLVPNFNSRNSVWVSFEAPSSGHVLVEGFSGTPVGIDLELALFQSTTNDCSGFFQHLYSGVDLSDFDESFTMTCLDPGRTYWVLVDGTANSSVGYFEMTVTDLGDIRPVSMRTDTVCFGGSIMVGTNIVHDSTGIFTDTLKIGTTNCDSIVITNLTVLDSITINLVQTRPAIGPAGTDGEAMVTPTGGDGNYTISWCDGTTGPTNVNLVAGTQCCVNVTDGQGCVKDTCFLVDFVEPIAPFGNFTEPNCNGEANGSLTFGVFGGRADYNYSYTNADLSISGAGIFTMEGDSLTVSDLPAGDYTINLTDQFFDTTFVITVTEPALLTIAIDQVNPISCFMACDGSVTATAAGGSGALTITSQPPAAGDGCAGTYTFVVTDANGCTATISQDLVEPVEFIASVVDFQDVSCFNGDDGSISVTTNGNPTAYNWSNGDTGPSISGLTVGLYRVTVTNADGCLDTIEQVISQPASPLTLSIVETQSIVCATDENGILSGQAGGGTGNRSFLWSDGQIGATATNLGPGNYSLTVTDGLGCETVANYQLDAPPVLTATTEARNLRCPDPLDAGQISVPTVNGGVGPYLYSLDGMNFGVDTLFVGLESGRYDITIQDALGCELVIPTDIEPAPVLVADLGQDRQILLGDSIALNLIVNSDDLIYSYSNDPAFQGNRQFVRPADNLTVTVSVFDTITECTASASVRILVDRNPRVYVPTAFSPNGDGVNDRFFPFGGTDVVNISGFRVFGRYGNLVYEAPRDFTPNDPAEGWDGTVGGQPSEIGVYVYSASVTFFDGRVEVVKGEITLLR